MSVVTDTATRSSTLSNSSASAASLHSWVVYFRSARLNRLWACITISSESYTPYAHRFDTAIHVGLGFAATHFVTGASTGTHDIRPRAVELSGHVEAVNAVDVTNDADDAHDADVTDGTQEDCDEGENEAMRNGDELDDDELDDELDDDELDDDDDDVDNDDDDTPVAGTYLVTESEKPAESDVSSMSPS